MTYVGELVLGDITPLMKSAEVSIRQVLAECKDQNAHDDVERSRDKEGDSPCGERGSAGAADELIDERHDELCGSAAHIPPSCGGAVDESNVITIVSLVGTSHFSI